MVYVRHSSLGVSLTSYARSRGFSWGGFVEFISQALVFGCDTNFCRYVGFSFIISSSDPSFLEYLVDGG